MNRISLSPSLVVAWVLLAACGSNDNRAEPSSSGGVAGQASAGGSAGSGGDAIGGGEAGAGGGSRPSDDPRVVYLNEASTNWAMARGYPRGTSYNPHERELNPNTVASVIVRWRAPSESRPLVQHDHRIFASYVEALEASDGTPLWTNSRATRSAVYCSGLLFQTYRGIQGIEPTNGEHRFDIPSADEATLLFGSAVAKGSAVVVPVLFQNWAAFPGEYLTDYRVFDVTTRLTRVVHTNFVSLVPPAITAGRAYTPALVPRLADGSIHWDYVVQALALDPELALAGWSSVIDQDVPAAAPSAGAAVIGGRVFASSADGNAIVALEQKTGEALWRARTRVAVRSLATTFDQVVVAGDVAPNVSRVEAYNPATGASLYATELHGGLGGNIAIGGQVIYVGTTSGELHMLHLETGALLNSVALGGSVTDPIVTRGRVFVATGEAVYSLGLEDAELAPESPESPEVETE